MTKSHYRLSAIVGVAVWLPQLLANIGCNSAAPASTELPTPKVTVAPATQEEVTDFDDYTGRTEASEIVEVRSRIFGFLKTVDFRDGDRVTAGQKLFTIEEDEYAAINNQSLSRIQLQTARHDLAKTKLARNEKLVKTGAVSQEDYEESVAAVKEAEAAIAAATADAAKTAVDLKYTTILSPISGRIDRAFVTKGNLLTGGQGSGTLLTKIVAEQPMYVYFDVDERSLLGYRRQRKQDSNAPPGSLKDLKLPCFLQLADETDFPHQGELDFAASEVNASTGTARIRAEFKNEDRALSSGLFVRVRVPYGKPYQAVMIPERALASDQSIKYVYVVGEDHKAERRNVELGRARGDLRIIKSGIKAGEQVIVKGLQRVKPGQQVEVEQAAPAPPVSRPE